MSNQAPQTFLLRPLLNEAENTLELHTLFAEDDGGEGVTLLHTLKSSRVIKLPLNQKAAKVWYEYLNLLHVYGVLPKEYYDKMVPEKARYDMEREEM